jgi:rhodanese-related sulfurtransferase
VSVVVHPMGHAVPDRIVHSSVLDEIFERAKARGSEMCLEYAGAVLPHEAAALFEQGAAVLIDVRTQPEWEYVGHVQGSVLIEWRRHGEALPVADFVAKVAAANESSQPILLLCRSAVRSHHAAKALAQAGYREVYNVLEGFEGDKDLRGRRGALGGWRAAGLDWVQG